MPPLPRQLENINLELLSGYSRIAPKPVKPRQAKPQITSINNVIQSKSRPPPRSRNQLNGATVANRLAKKPAPPPGPKPQWVINARNTKKQATNVINPLGILNSQSTLQNNTDNLPVREQETKFTSIISPLTLPLKQPEFFEKDHVFYLSGHGSDDPISTQRYTLKDNEYYINVTTCGFVTMASQTQTNKHIYELGKSNITVPQETNSSYAIFNNLNMFKNTEHYDKFHNADIKHESDTLKVYVPFSESNTTRTIPPTKYYMFNYHLMKKNANVISNVYNLRDLGIDPNLSYDIYQIGLSGIIPSNSFIGNKYNNIAKTSVYSNGFNIESVESPKELENKNIIISKIFNIKRPYASMFFYIIPSDNGYNIDIFAPGLLHEYNRNVIRHVLRYSIIPFHPIVLRRLAITNYDDLLTSSIDVSELFSIARSWVDDNKPILIINTLCRALPDYLKKTRHKLRELERNYSTLFSSARSVKANRFQKSKEGLKQQLAEINSNITRRSQQVPWYKKMFTTKPANNNQTKKRIMNKQYKAIQNRLYGKQSFFTTRKYAPTINQISKIVPQEQIENWRSYLATKR